MYSLLMHVTNPDRYHEFQRPPVNACLQSARSVDRQTKLRKQFHLTNVMERICSGPRIPDWAEQRMRGQLLIRPVEICKQFIA